MNAKKITNLAGTIAVLAVAAAGANAQSSTTPLRTTQTGSTPSRHPVTIINSRHNTLRSASKTQIPHTLTPPPPSQVIRRIPPVTTARPQSPAGSVNKTKPSS